MPHIPFVCVACRNIVLLHPKTLSRVLITALRLSSETHPMARHIRSSTTSYRKGQSHLCPYLPGRFAGSCMMVGPCFSFCLLKRKRRSTVVVSHVLILSRVFKVQDQFSLPKEKKANMWSTSRRHLIFQGMSLPFENQNLFPTSRIRGLHSLFNCILRVSLHIHGTSQDLEFRLITPSRLGID